MKHDVQLALKVENDKQMKRDQDLKQDMSRKKQEFEENKRLLKEMVERGRNKNRLLLEDPGGNAAEI